MPALHPPASDGVEVELEVGFEPSVVGEALKDTLVVGHPSAGDYLVPLSGRCGPPKPLGPVYIGEVRPAGMLVGGWALCARQASGAST